MACALLSEVYHYTCFLRYLREMCLQLKNSLLYSSDLNIGVTDPQKHTPTCSKAHTGSYFKALYAVLFLL